MRLKQFFWALGFDYDQLWPADALERAEAKKERLSRLLRERHGVLVRLRKNINLLAQRDEQEGRLLARQERYDRCVMKVRALERRIVGLEEEIRRRRAKRF